MYPFPLPHGYQQRAGNSGPFNLKVQEIFERAALLRAAHTSVTAEFLAVCPLMIKISTIACQPVDHFKLLNLDERLQYLAVRVRILSSVHT